MAQTSGLVTAEQLERMPEEDDRWELVRGRLVRMSPAAPRHGRIAGTILALLWGPVESSGCGQVWTEVGFRLASAPDTVRAPDVSFVRHDRLPARDAAGFYRGAPDLAVEVLSPDDRPSDVRERVRDYLVAGALMVVVIDPQSRRAIVHRPETSPLILTAADVLELDAVVPGVRLELRDLLK